MELVWFVLIGVAAGWLAGQLMKGGGFSVVGDIVVGVIGALLWGVCVSHPKACPPEVDCSAA